MSLINEALKKAQHSRVEGSPDPLAPTATTPVRRGKERPGQMMMLLGVGAVVLVVLSVVVTVYLLQRPANVAIASPAATQTSDARVPKADAPQPASATTEAVAPNTSIKVPEVRVSVVPLPTAGPAATTLTVANVPPAAPAKAAAPPTHEAPASVPSRVGVDAGSLPGVGPSDAASFRPATPPPIPPAAPKADDRVSAFVDAVRVAGIRSSGGDSRVLMNEKVFRVNDIVDRSLGVRLIKVGADSLTFSDANGFTYVKQF